MTATDRLFGGSALRYLAVLAAAALTFTLLPLAGTASGQEEEVPECDDAPFTDREDIPAAHRNNVDCAFEEGIVQGFTDNTYRPALSVRRDQMSTFIHGVLDAAGVDVPEGESDTFTDVPDGNVHSDAVNALAEAEIVFGGPGDLSSNQYGPALSTRRDQMTSFMIRAAEFATGNTYGSNSQQFPDVPASNVHFQNVNAAAENNLALGRTDGTFGPGDETRRDQMASFMIRLLLFIRGEIDPTTPDPTPEPTPEPTTVLDIPELQSATFVRMDELGAPCSDDVVVVRYAFDESVTSVDASMFWLFGPNTDDDFEIGCDFSRPSGQPSAVDVAFPAWIWDTATTATVEDSAVEDLDGDGNAYGSDGVRSHPAGATQATELLSIGGCTAATSPEMRVNFTFEHEVAAGDVTPSDFSVVTSNGLVYEATGVQTTGTRAMHTLQFDRTAGWNPDNSTSNNELTAAQFCSQLRRGYTEGGSGATDYRHATAGNTDSGIPDLDQIILNETDGEVDFVFSESVEDLTFTPGDFTLFYVDGSEVSGTGGGDRVTNQPRRVRVEFDPDEVNKLVMGGSVDECAVTSASTGNRCNRIDSTAGPNAFGPGEVAGPVLQSVTVAPRADFAGAQQGHRVIWTFDIALEPAATGPGFWEGGLWVYNEEGDAVDMDDASVDCALTNSNRSVRCDTTRLTGIDHVVENGARGAVDWWGVWTDDDWTTGNITNWFLPNYHDSRPITTP